MLKLIKNIILKIFSKKPSSIPNNKKKALLISTKEIADSLFEYCYQDKNSEFSIKKILIWDNFSLKNTDIKKKFYSSFEDIYETIYHETWDKIIVVGEKQAPDKKNIIIDLASKNNIEVSFIEKDDI